MVVVGALAWYHELGVSPSLLTRLATYNTDYIRHVYTCLSIPGSTINARKKERATWQTMRNGGVEEKVGSAQRSAQARIFALCHSVGCLVHRSPAARNTDVTTARAYCNQVIFSYSTHENAVACQTGSDC
jgi:hypothetical protein